MKNATVQTPKFKYGDKVRVVNGFHRTKTGRVVRYYGDTNYTVDLHKWYHGINSYENTIIEPEENLELV